MCDYSLHQLASRQAKLGDTLVTTKFSGSVTRGFSAVGEPDVAVCVLPGTELAFEKEAAYEHPLARLMPSFGFGKLDGKVARFRKINLHSPSAHHDALEFENGKIVLLTRLCVGQRATVLQLPVHARPVTKDLEERRPAALVA
jgi:hypothetical protein